MNQNTSKKKSLFYKYKILCFLILLFFYTTECSFVWNALSVYVFAYGQTADEAEDGLEDFGDTDMISAEDILSANSMEQTSKDVDEAAQLSKDDWRLILINKQHSIPEDYTFTFGSISTLKGTMKCDERIVSDLLQMLQGAKDDGINLQICSPYRDMDRQVYLFDKKIKTYMNQGMSYIDAYALTAQAVTVPGASEHQIGLALDIVCDSYAYLNEGFGETEAGKWLAEHSCEYGFILRYPKGKEYITGIEYEPWHFRYVGIEAATIMTEEELTLEEFVASLSDLER